MSKYIVLDIVFYAGSLNYDKGIGNYQELKKITKWNGKQYPFVSRYALRYSMLETAKMISAYEIAKGNELKEVGTGNKKVIQPNPDLLLSGKILNYPEFDLFGYLITDTDPQNFKTAPVKLSHAISMTPFNYDALFNANIGLANRMRETTCEMKPNLFTSEEHYSYYIYSIVIDVDNVGKLEVYLNTKNKDNKQVFNINKKDWEIQEKEGDYTMTDGTSKIEITKGGTIKIGKDEIKDIKGECSKKDNCYTLNFQLKGEEEDLVIERIEKLIKVIFDLKRNIKGRSENLEPKLMVVGLYDNKAYNTYSDKIELLSETNEEFIDEIEEIIDPENSNRKIVKVKHRVIESAKPLFKLKDFEGSNLTKNEITKQIKSFLSKNNKSDEGDSNVFYYSDNQIDLKTE